MLARPAEICGTALPTRIELKEHSSQSLEIFAALETHVHQYPSLTDGSEYIFVELIPGHVCNPVSQLFWSGAASIAVWADASARAGPAF